MSLQEKMIALKEKDLPVSQIADILHISRMECYNIIDGIKHDSKHDIKRERILDILNDISVPTLKFHHRFRQREYNNLSLEKVLTGFYSEDDIYFILDNLKPHVEKALKRNTDIKHGEGPASHLTIDLEATMKF